MNVTARVFLVRAALLATGAVSGVGGTMALSNGAHEKIQIALTDTVSMRFAFKTDTVLGLVGGNIHPRNCGTSAIYFRIWRGSQQISGDTVDVTVPCAPVVLPPVSTLDTVITVCARPNPDSLKKYLPNGADTTVSPLLIPCLVPELAGDSVTLPFQGRFVSYARTRPKPTVPIA